MFTYKYHFEGSSSIWTVESEKSVLTSAELCELILKSIFKDEKPTCGVQCHKDSINPDEDVSITRDFRTFNKEKPKVKAPKVKKRRWRSRSPQRQRVPIYNYRYY